MPTIQPHGAGWRVAWREGGRSRKSATLPTRAMAEAEEAAIAERLAAQRKVPRHAIVPWPEVVLRWAATRRPGRYVDQAKTTLRALPWASVADATPLAMAELKVGTRRIVHAVLRWAWAMLNQPVDQRALAVPRPVGRAKPRPLVDDARVAELVASCAAAAPGTGGLAHMLATYGHRAESLVAMTAAAVDLRAGTITLPVKSGDVVQHPLLPETVAILRPLVKAAKDGPIFLNHLDEAWEDGRAFASWFHHTHGLGYYDAFKRPAITRMLQVMDAKTVASITGHRTVSLLLNTYARTNEARQREAVSKLRSVGRTPNAPQRLKKSSTRP